MKNFWQKLNKPVMALAPMEEVTDTVFRQIVAECGRPDVFFTEFTSVEGMAHPKGLKHIQHRLVFSKNEHPIVAQIWGINPENFKKAARKIVEMGFDGIDINMGCPERNITRQGSCSALIKNPDLAKEIIEATKEGAGDLPVSVKTRIGFSKIQTEEWIGFLLQQNLAALTVHGRTAAEMSEVPAHWDEIAKAVKRRDQIAPQTIILGNGDVQSLEDAEQKIKETGVDGVMIGRGIFHNVFVFNKSKKEVTPEDRLAVLLKHVDLYTETWRKTKNYHILKKFFKAYVNNFPGAGDLRAKLMETDQPEQVRPIIESYLEILASAQ